MLLDRLERLREEASRDASHGSFFDALLGRLHVKYECSDADLGRIPRSGPVVVVVNHPFGLVEGPVLGSLLLRVRPDFKFLANSLLTAIPELANWVVPVDPFGSQGAVKANWRPLRDALRWVRGGGLLVVFPAGEVSSLRPEGWQVTEGRWHENAARLVALSGAPAVPLFIHGANSPIFHIAGLLHPELRTALLPRELFNKEGHTIRLCVGQTVLEKRLRGLTPRQAADFLQSRTQVLHERRTRPLSFPVLRRSNPFERRVALAEEPKRLRAELDSLPGEQRLLTSGHRVVFTAKADQIPRTLREIGRLRELAFRQVGEGTGRRLDIDRFDATYRHLLLWNAERNEVIGAYRMQSTAAADSEGLYTSTLFRFKTGFLPSLHPALELGRSFIRPEYQKSHLSLLLLWKGIGQVLAREPQHRFLFGPVSISREYRPAARALMKAFLSAHRTDHELASAVTPVREFRYRGVAGCDLVHFGSQLSTVEELSEVVSEIQSDGKGLPVLLRHYLNLGGQMVAFNADRNFSNVLDGLIVVDLLKLDRHLLKRYLGEEGARRFLLWHGSASTGCQ